MMSTYIRLLSISTSKVFLPRTSTAKMSRRCRRSVAAATCNVQRSLCITLILSLCATSTPAAPQTIVAVTKESSVSLAFWFHASGVRKLASQLLQGQIPNLTRQETQQDRDGRVARIQIYPGDLTVDLDDQVQFSAIAYDRYNTPVGGIKMRWRALETLSGRRAGMSPQGKFEATGAGAFSIVAEGASKTATTNVVVRPGVRRNLNAIPKGIRQVSTRDLPSVTVAKEAVSTESLARSSKRSANQPKRRGGSERAHAKRSNTAVVNSGSSSVAISPLLPGEGWGDSNYWSADDPGNRVGAPPGGAMDDGAGNGNFQIAAPVLGLPGRGIDLSLGLAYNSRLWNKADSQITYDIDRGWPAPGWSLGFSKILGMGVYRGGMIVEADGTRHAYNGTITEYPWGTTFVGHTTDGSFIDYTYTSGAGGGIVSAQAKLPNGTVINYGAAGPGAVYPVSIEEPNGNYITIAYVNNAGPRIQTITDTLGRAINFHYDAGNFLTAITGPGLSGGTRTLVRLNYRQISLGYSFSGLTPVVRELSPWVVNAIYYPGTNTGYWFGDADSYSSYGMLTKVSERRNMSFSATSLNDQGTVTSTGAITREEIYGYPLTTGDPGGSNLTDAPTYPSMTESWTRDGVNFDQAVTHYSSQPNASPRTVSITLPNGTKSIQYSHNEPGNFKDGLVYQDQTLDSANNVLQSSSVTWVQGAYESPRPTRVEATNERLQMTATEFSYGSVYNQVTEVRNYDYGGTTLLRATRTQYQNSTNYTGRHIFNLPLVVEVFGGDGVTRVSRTDYQYDGQTLTDAPGVVMHYDSHNPYAPEYLVSPGTCCEYDYYYVNCITYCPDYWTTDYNPATDYRGNVTQVTTYADAVNLTSPVTENRRYDITGNLVKSSTSCCEQTTFDYSVDTQYAYPLSQTRGSASDPYAQVLTSATYDFNTALVLSATDANGRTSQTSYFSETLRPQTASLPSGSHADYAYDDAGMNVTATTYLESHPTHATIADQNVKLLNGRGQVRQERALGAGGVWDIVDAVYDNMGRVSQQTLPYRDGETQYWTTSYDALSRAVSVQAPDGSTSETFYNEVARPSVASSLSGETTRVRDAWGRERWGRTDAQGRLVEVVEPSPSGSGSVFEPGALHTAYSYNTLGNLTLTNQGGQLRSFKYDSLGRLIAQKLAEKNATLNDAGIYQASGGTWSDVFVYDERSNLISRTDARGVKTVYSFNNDPLNRLQSISWDTSGFGDTANPILPAATVTYQYRTKISDTQLLDITQMNSVTTAGVSTESYVYDVEGRVSTKTLTLTSRPSYPFVTDYIFDSLDRITDVRYPAEYGNGIQPRKVVHHDYDVASRLSALTVDGATHASQMVYNAASQTTSLSVGASGPNQIIESYGYEPQTGLLTNQTLARSATPTNYLLNLSYDYMGTNGKRTGQLVKILNNLNHNKDRSYNYDALGRLVQAKGGPAAAPLWTQNYSYDNFGNRTSVSASGYSAKLNTLDSQSAVATMTPGRADVSPAPPRPSLATEGGSRAPERPSRLNRDSGRSAPEPLRNSHHARLGTLPITAATSPQSPPSKIAFASNRDGRAQIYLMNTDGTNQTRLTNNAGNDDAPRWSPNNSKIVFQSDRDVPFCAIFDIYTMNADGSGQTRLTTDINDDSAPVWSPDGTKIAFQSMRNATKYQIYVMNADGSGQTNISNSAANDTQPSWSPDGTKIAFSSDRDSSTGQSDIYVMNSNGSNQTRLTFTNDPFTDSQPAWSVDGLKLAFTSTRDSTIDTWTDADDFEIPEDDGQTFPRSRLNINKEVYVMNANGSAQTRLTNTLENDETPAWSGDGSKIVFRSDRERDNYDPVPQIWVMNPDGTAQINLSNDECGDFCPNWQNLPSNLPPTVSFTSPANGASFTAPANINITANASDSDGTISKVDFYQGTTLIGTDTSAPYSFNWTNVAAGNYSMTAKATDNGGAATTSGAVNINVNALPSVSVSSPANGATFTAPASISISASASDSDGTISGVEFFHGTTSLGTDSSAPYSANWNNVAPGNYSLTARATDNSGATTTSAAVNIAVNANGAPTVSITAPANGASFTAPANVSITVNASDSDGTINSVEFYQGTTLLGTETTAPYAFNWTNVAAGDYSLTAKATDNGGSTTTSTAVSITVNPDQPPTVTITGPANGATFTAPASISITANASDSDGTVSSVEFYQGTTLIGTDTTAPYAFNWNNVNAGSYSLTAKATDNAGATTTSQPVSITVNAAPVPIPLDGHASLSYDTASNRITTSGFAYDAAGNQVRALIPGSSGSQRFRYDAANRLAQVRRDDNNTVIASYTYGDSNERLILEEAGLRTYYACDGKAEYTESGSSTTPTWSKSYIYLGGRLLSTLTPNGSGGEAVQYHHPDRLGTRLVTNAQDTTSFEQVTLPFGMALDAESTDSTNRRFTTYDRSATTGLDYAMNRHYDSQQARFTQVDPIGMSAASLESPQTLNLYSYCGNDPVNFVDPSGLFFKKLFGWIGKLFKWTANAFKVTLRVVAKLLANKWVQLALLIAIAAFTGPGPLLLGFAETAGFTITTAQILSSAVLVAGEAARRWQPQQQKKDLPDCSTGQVPCDAGGVIITSTREIRIAVMQPAPSENSSWFRLAWEFFSGRGARDRQFGPGSSMTVGLRSSPAIANNRSRFCAGGGRRYRGSGSFGLLGLGSSDGLLRAGRNMPRQFVGSFNIAITPSTDGSALFEVTNTTHLKSLLYQIPGVQDVHRSEMGALSNTTQTYWWTEKNPCGGP